MPKKAEPKNTVRLVRSAYPGPDPDTPNMVRQWTVHWRGATVSVTEDDLDDLTLIELHQAGDTVAAMRHLIGEEQWAAVKEAARDPKTGRVRGSVYAEFDALLSEFVDPTAPAPASPSSSPSTPAN